MALVFVRFRRGVTAVEEYGEGERAHRVAYSALKHKYEQHAAVHLPRGSGDVGP